MDRGDLEKIFDELISNSMSSLECLRMNKILKELKAELKESMIKSDDLGSKKLRVISNEVNCELDMIDEVLNRNEDELKEIDVNGMLNEVENVGEWAMANDKNVYSFLDGQKKEIMNELVKKYPESLLNLKTIDVMSRTSEYEVKIHCCLKFLNEIVSYMSNEFDIKRMNGIEFDKFCQELMRVNIPFRMDIMDRLYNGSNEYGVGWKNRSFLLHGNEYKLMMNHMQLKMNNITYNRTTNRIECMIMIEEILLSSYQIDLIKAKPFNYIYLLNDFECYLMDPHQYTKNESITYQALNKLFELFYIDIKDPIVRKYLMRYIPSLCIGSNILRTNEYDSYLREWLGNDIKWKLLYRASEHGYRARSFHECCDDKGPILMIIKSDEGWIFGGYTTQPWKGIGI